MPPKPFDEILHHPTITMDDLHSQEIFLLNMKGLGGNGVRKAPLAKLIRLLLFRLGLEYQLKQAATGHWTASLKKRGGRKTLQMGPWRVSEEFEAELRFLHAFLETISREDRLRSFNVWTEGTNALR